MSVILPGRSKRVNDGIALGAFITVFMTIYISKASSLGLPIPAELLTSALSQAFVYAGIFAIVVRMILYAFTRR